MCRNGDNVARIRVVSLAFGHVFDPERSERINTCSDYVVESEQLFCLVVYALKILTCAVGLFLGVDTAEVTCTAAAV